MDNVSAVVKANGSTVPAKIKSETGKNRLTDLQIHNMALQTVIFKQGGVKIKQKLFTKTIID